VVDCNNIASRRVERDAVGVTKADVARQRSCTATSVIRSRNKINDAAGRRIQSVASDSRRSTCLLEQAGLGRVECSRSDSRRGTRELQAVRNAQPLARTAGKRDAVAVTEADRTAGISRIADHQPTNSSLRSSGSGGTQR